MVKNIFPITVGDGRTTEELVLAGDYRSSSHIINSENFPTRNLKNGTREIILLEFDHEPTLEQVLAKATEEGNLERPNYEDALYFGEQYPDVQREKPVVFLHEPRLDGPRGTRGVLCLFSSGIAGGRCIGLGWFKDKWQHNCCFAFVKKL